MKEVTESFDIDHTKELRVGVIGKGVLKTFSLMVIAGVTATSAHAVNPWDYSYRVEDVARRTQNTANSPSYSAVDGALRSVFGFLGGIKRGAFDEESKRVRDYTDAVEKHLDISLSRQFATIRSSSMALGSDSKVSGGLVLDEHTGATSTTMRAVKGDDIYAMSDGNGGYVFIQRTGRSTTLIVPRHARGLTVSDGALEKALAALGGPSGGPVPVSEVFGSVETFLTSITPQRAIATPERRR